MVFIFGLSNFYFWPKIQVGLLKIRLYAVRPNLTLAFRVSAFRYKPLLGGTPNGWISNGRSVFRRKIYGWKLGIIVYGRILYWPNPKWPSLNWPNLIWPNLNWPNLSWPKSNWPIWPSLARAHSGSLGPPPIRPTARSFLNPQ